MPRFRLRVRHPLHPRYPAVRAAAAPAGESAALAGSFEELRNAALSGARARKAIFILTGEGTRWPSRQDRDELWRLFQVPAYVIWLDGEGRQLCWECEAQEGLHAVTDRPRHHAGFRLETDACACGRPGARLFRDTAA